MGGIEQLYKRAEEAFAKRNYDYSVELFSQIINLDPNHSEARKALRATIVTKYKEGKAPNKFKLGMLFGKAKVEIAAAPNNPQKKMVAAQKYLVQDPNNATIRTELAAALLGLGHNEACAVEAEMAIDADSKNIPAAKILCTALKVLGKIGEAQSALEKVARYASEDRDLLKLQRDLAAIATTQKGFEDTAGKEGYRSAMKDKDQAGALERRQHMIKDVDDAKAFISDLIKEFGEKPDYKTARRIGDTALDYLQDSNMAREWFKKAVELNPRDSTLKDRLEDVNLRVLEAKMKKAKKENDPKLKEYLKKLITFKIQIYERRSQDRPTDMGIRFELGRAYYSAGSGMLDKAISQFQQAVKDPKKKIDSHFYLGLGFQKKGLFDMADAQYEKSAKAGIMGQEKKLLITYNRAKCNAQADNFDVALQLGKTIMEADINYKDISSLVTQWGKEAK